MRKRKFTETVGVLFTEETYQQLIEITDDKEISSSQFIRDLVDREIRKINKGEKSNE
jgi:hypothetical protein